MHQTAIKFTLMKFHVKIVIFLTLLLIGINLNGFSENNVNDSSSLLVYNSALESRGFGLLFAGKPDYLNLSIAADPEATEADLEDARVMISNEVQVLRLQISQIKKPVKALKYIFDHVQTGFLKHYELDAEFNKMFKSGNYNCLTATILYSLILDELGYRYTPKVLPGHVYLIVYDKEIPYLFETTDPENGFIQLNDAVLTRTIQSLRLFKYIQSDNIENQASSNIFDRYYLKLNTTDLRGLASYQYVNAMVLSGMKQQNVLAYNSLKKAMVLTPMDELSSLQEQLLRAAVGSLSFKSALRASYIVEYFKISGNPNKTDMVASEFQQIVNQCLYGSFPTPDSLRSIYVLLSRGISDSILQSKIKEDYFVHMTNYWLLKLQTDSAFNYAYEGFSSAKTNLQLNVLLIKLIDFYTGNDNSHERNLKIIDSLGIKYPKIKDFDIYKTRQCDNILNLATRAFMENNESTGEGYLNMFESFAETYSEGRQYCDPAVAYSVAGSYYFRKGKIAKAKTTLQKGLTYSPGNWELENKLKQIGR